VVEGVFSQHHRQDHSGLAGGIQNQQYWEVLEVWMKVNYDPEVDVLRILFSNYPVEESDENKPGVIIDYDKQGNIVGMEILEASKHMDNPRSVEFAVAAG